MYIFYSIMNFLFITAVMFVKESRKKYSEAKTLSSLKTKHHSDYFLSIFFYFFGCVGSSLLCTGFSLVATSGGYPLMCCAGFSLRWLLVVEHRLWVRGLQQLWLLASRAQAQQLRLAGSRAQAQQLWHTGLVALWHVGSSRTRAQTCVPCIGRRILNHCAAREVLLSVFFFLFVNL